MDHGDSLARHHVVVSGGSGALGVAVVAAMAERGARVTVLDRAAADRRSPGGTVTFVPVELSDEHAVAAAYSALPRLDASLHLAGGFDMQPIEQATLARVEAMWRMNAVSCFLCCREAVRAMRRTRGANGGAAAGWTPRGWIVNVAARPALEPVGGMLAYSMSKAAVANLTRSLAAEVLEDGILVNAIVPSIMDTPANRRAMPTADHSRWPRVDDVARVIRALASPSNRTTSGALVPVYGAVTPAAG